MWMLKQHIFSHVNAQTLHFYILIPIFIFYFHNVKHVPIHFWLKMGFRGFIDHSIIFFSSFKISVTWFGVPSYDFPGIKICSKKNTKICHKVWNFSLLILRLVFLQHQLPEIQQLQMPHSQLTQLTIPKLFQDYVSFLQSKDFNPNYGSPSKQWCNDQFTLFSNASSHAPHSFP